MRALTRKVYFTVFIAALAVLWAALAIAPVDPSDWLLENVLLFVGVAVLVGTRRLLPLSGVSYTPLDLSPGSKTGRGAFYLPRVAFS